jgi:phage baseplate assembly protein W
MTTVYGTTPTDPAISRILSLPHRSIAGLTPLPGRNSDDPYFGRVTGRERILSGLDNLFNTGGGERLMMPDYGLDLLEFLFEPLDSVIVGQIRDRVMEQIITYFGEEIQVLSLEVGITDNTKYNGAPGVVIMLKAIVTETDEPLTLTTEI